MAIPPAMPASEPEVPMNSGLEPPLM
jgi:hypothetical protein